MRTAAPGLLISWATPAASLPMAASLSASMSFCWLRFSSSVATRRSRYAASVASARSVARRAISSRSRERVPCFSSRELKSRASMPSSSREASGRRRSRSFDLVIDRMVSAIWPTCSTIRPPKRQATAPPAITARAIASVHTQRRSKLAVTRLAKAGPEEMDQARVRCAEARASSRAWVFRATSARNSAGSSSCRRPRVISAVSPTSAA